MTLSGQHNSALVVALVGMAGSGKDEVIKLLLNRRPGEVILLRKIVELELRNQSLPITNKTLRECSTTLRQRFGRDIIARKCLPMIKDALERTDLVILNAIKGTEEIDYLRHELPCPIISVAIHSSPRTRFERLSNRGLAWDMKDWSSFIWRDKAELEWGVGNAIALADCMIVNEGTLAELSANVDRIWSSLQRAMSSDTDWMASCK